VTQLLATSWHDQPAWALESDALRVVTVPGMGAKLVSLVHKPAAHEWLLGPADRPFRPVPYGASFVDQDMSGWDEMFPTIEACPYPGEGPYAGAALPDHGEVWALPWDVTDAADGRLTLRVEGRALPYRLTRTLSLPDARTLRLDYAATNTGDAPLAALWAAHPQFAVTPATEVRLPDAVADVISVGALPAWAPVGMRLAWPVASDPDGQPFPLDRVTSAALRRSRKVYLLPEQGVSWAALVEPGAGHWLRLEWDPAQVPYLGIWADEGHYNPALTIALEPSTGFYDSLARAWEAGRVPVLSPGDTLTWGLTVRVGLGDAPA